MHLDILGQWVSSEAVPKQTSLDAVWRYPVRANYLKETINTKQSYWSAEKQVSWTDTIYMKKKLNIISIYDATVRE